MRARYNGKVLSHFQRGLLCAIGFVFLMAFQINQLLTASFTIELFDYEILRVENDTKLLSEPRSQPARPFLPQHERINFLIVTPKAPAAWPVPPPPKALPNQQSEIIACGIDGLSEVDLPLPSLPPPPPPVRTKPDPGCELFICWHEEMPALIGGLAALLQKIQYPTMAKNAGLEGRVIVQFIVDEQGRVNEPRVVRGIGGGCDEEAVRVVSQARFRPGRQRGKPVEMKMSLPVTFKLR